MSSGRTIALAVVALCIAFVAAGCGPEEAEHAFQCQASKTKPQHELSAYALKKAGLVKLSSTPYAVKKIGSKRSGFWDWCGEYEQLEDHDECEYLSWEEKEQYCFTKGWNCSTGTCSGTGFCSLHYTSWLAAPDYYCETATQINCHCNCFGWVP